MLIPYEWIEIANENWRKLQEDGFVPKKSCKLGVDVAGMGRDDSVLCLRYGNYVSEFEAHQSAGTADHMHVAGMITRYLDKKGAKALLILSAKEQECYLGCRNLGTKMCILASSPRAHVGCMI